MKVIAQDMVCGLFTVTVDTYIHNKKQNDLITDEFGRKFKIKSVAMMNTHNDTTFVLEPLDGKLYIGEYLT